MPRECRRINAWHGCMRLVSFTVPALALTVAAMLPTGAAHGSAPSAPRPGAWTQLGADQGGTTATLLHLSNGNDLAVWMAPVVSNRHYYAAAELKPNGGLASQPSDVFGGHDWDDMDQYSPPTLLSVGGQPLLVFEGSRNANNADPYSKGCIYGDLRTPTGWQLQSWSLSSACTQTAHFGATVTQSGVLSAAWPGGWPGGNGLRYRIGVSPTIPAAEDDQHISTAPGQAGVVAEATETRSQHVYAAWERFFSKPASQDGVWAADLSANPTPVKAPDSGSNTVARQLEPVAMASPAGRGGIYVAYCDNANPCSRVELWRYGDKRAVAVPASASPTSVSLSAGPAGRLWIAWWSAKNGTVRVVRTNEAGNRFGPVETHAGPRGCTGDGNGTIKISSGSQQQLDVVLSCFGFVSAHGANVALTTQSLVPLQVAASRVTIDHKTGGAVTYRVSDVGDAVAGTTVRVGGRKATTNRSGQVTFYFAKGSRPGSFHVVAARAGYLKASTFLQIR